MISPITAMQAIFDLKNQGFTIERLYDLWEQRNNIRGDKEGSNIAVVQLIQLIHIDKFSEGRFKELISDAWCFLGGFETSVCDIERGPIVAD